MTDHVVVLCSDKPESGDLRQNTRPAHLEWLKQAPFSIAAAGPLLAQDGETMVGSLLVVQSGDLEAVRRWAAEDPYAQAGLFESVTVAPWRHLLGAGLPRGSAEQSHG